jgi:hypothetical protein
MSSHDLLRNFFAIRKLARPDGRPLYAYRCTLGEGEEIRQHLVAVLASTPAASRLAAGTEQLFCLWAAEWWRRNHEHGRWRWEELLSALGAEAYGPGNGGYPQLLTIVGNGLRAWNRDLIRTAHGRAFLVTLGCEGGLPLKLVTREGGRLRDYFRSLLEELRTYGGTLSAQELAERNQHRLPVRLRQDVVFALSAQLTDAVWRLQQEVRDADDPVAALDWARPDWRIDLPLDLDDRVARALLTNLFDQAARLATGGGGRIRFHRLLVPAGDGWSVHGRWSLPSALQEEEIRQLFSIGDAVTIPQRLELRFREDTGGAGVLALGIRRNGNGAARFELQHLPAAQRLNEGAAALGARDLILRIGQETWESRNFPGAAELGTGTWTFASAGQERGEPAELQGEDSIRVRSPEALVVAPEELTPALEAGATCEHVGEACGRKVFRVTGTVRFADPDGTSASVRAGAAGAIDGSEFLLCGGVLEIGPSGLRCHRGPPTLRERKAGGAWVDVPRHRVQWLSDIPGSRWTAGADPIGRGRLRLVEDGEIRFSATVTVVPPSIAIRFIPRADGTGGTIEIDRSGADQVLVVAGSGVRSTVEPRGDTYRVVVEAGAGAASELSVDLEWRGRGRARLRLPAPIYRAGFALPGGAPLPPAAVVPMGRIAGARAVVIAPHAGCALHVEGDLRGGNVRNGAIAMIRHPMDEIAPGCYELDLAEIERTLLHSLDAAVDVEAFVRLRIQSNDLPDLPMTELRVSRFDLDLEAEEDGDHVRLSEASLCFVAPPDVERLRLEAVSLLDPGSDPIELERAGGARWQLPPGGVSRPLLITGWDGGWARTRPLSLGTSGAPLEENCTALAALYQEPPAVPRKVILQSVVERLKGSADDGDWPIVDGMFRWSESIPVATFDVVRSVAADPEAAALAAFRIPDAYFSTLWRELETLPFWWKTVPRSAWDRAIQTMVDGWRRELATLGAHAESLRPGDLLGEMLGRAINRVTRELPWIEAALAVTRSRVLGEPIPGHIHFLVGEDYLAGSLGDLRKLRDSCPALTTQQDSALAVDDLDTLLERVAQEEAGRTLVVPRSGQWRTEHRASHVNAPVIAVAAALWDVELTPGQLRTLRRIEDVDSGWFEESYSIAYLYGFGANRAARTKMLLNQA